MSAPVSQADRITIEKLFDEMAAPVGIGFLSLILNFWQFCREALETMS